MNMQHFFIIFGFIFLSACATHKYQNCENYIIAFDEKLNIIHEECIDGSADKIFSNPVIT